MKEDPDKQRLKKEQVREARQERLQDSSKRHRTDQEGRPGGSVNTKGVGNLACASTTCKAIAKESPGIYSQTSHLYMPIGILLGAGCISWQYPPLINSKQLCSM